MILISSGKQIAVYFTVFAVNLTNMSNRIIRQTRQGQSIRYQFVNIERKYFNKSLHKFIRSTLNLCILKLGNSLKQSHKLNINLAI